MMRAGAIRITSRLTKWARGSVPSLIAGVEPELAYQGTAEDGSAVFDVTDEDRRITLSAGDIENAVFDASESAVIFGDGTRVEFDKLTSTPLFSLPYVVVLSSGDTVTGAWVDSEFYEEDIRVLTVIRDGPGVRIEEGDIYSLGRMPEDIAESVRAWRKRRREEAEQGGTEDGDGV
jgi:hypothetical protein